MIFSILKGSFYTLYSNHRNQHKNASRKTTQIFAPLIIFILYSVHVYGYYQMDGEKCANLRNIYYSDSFRGSKHRKYLFTIHWVLGREMDSFYLILCSRMRSHNYSGSFRVLTQKYNIYLLNTTEVELKIRDYRTTKDICPDFVRHLTHCDYTPRLHGMGSHAGTFTLHFFRSSIRLADGLFVVFRDGSF